MILGKAFAATGVKLAVGGALVATAAGGTAVATAAHNHAPSTPHTPFGQTVKEQVEACKAQTTVSVGECVSTFTTAHNPGTTRHTGDSPGDDRPKPAASAAATATPHARVTPDGDAAEDTTEPADDHDVAPPRASGSPDTEHNVGSGHDGDSHRSGSSGHGDAH